jgi:hypothetical protein
MIAIDPPVRILTLVLESEGLSTQDSKSGRIKVWVKTWGELLHECLGRHEYVRSKLEIEVTEEEAVAHLQKMYMEVVTPAPNQKRVS